MPVGSHWSGSFRRSAADAWTVVCHSLLLRHPIVSLAVDMDGVWQLIVI